MSTAVQLASTSNPVPGAVPWKTVLSYFLPSAEGMRSTIASYSVDLSRLNCLENGTMTDSVKGDHLLVVDLGIVNLLLGGLGGHPLCLGVAGDHVERDARAGDGHAAGELHDRGGLRHSLQHFGGDALGEGHAGAGAVEVDLGGGEGHSGFLSSVF